MDKDRIETVKVVRPDSKLGYRIRNKSDLTDKDVLYQPKKRGRKPKVKADDNS